MKSQRINLMSRYLLGLVLSWAIVGGASPLLCQTSKATSFVPCLNRFTGQIVVRPKCRAIETRVSVNDLRVTVVGPQGPQGSQGPRGVSAFDPLPSGVTIRGVIGGVHYDDFNFNHPVAYVATLPASMNGLLSADSVIIAATSVATASNGVFGTNECQTESDCLNIEESSTSFFCTGNSANPTAPPGKCCIYVRELANVQNLRAAAEGSNAQTLGLVITGFSRFNSTSYLSAVYACTAP